MAEKPQPPEMPMYQKTLAQAQTGSVEVSALPRLTIAPHPPTISEMLLQKKQHLEYQLQIVNEALAQAAIQKDTMILLDSIAKTNIRQEY